MPITENTLFFPTLSPQARLWIYGFARSFSENEKQLLSSRLSQFVNDWKTHGEVVSGDYAVVYDRFVLLAADTGVSGCSIDSSVRVLKEFRAESGLDGLDRNLVFFKNAEGVLSLPRAAFAAEVRKGAIATSTKVFDLTIESVDDLRKGLFEKTFAESWHARAFPLTAVK